LVSRHWIVEIAEKQKSLQFQADNGRNQGLTGGRGETRTSKPREFHNIRFAKFMSRTVSSQIRKQLDTVVESEIQADQANQNAPGGVG
jgi:hypothetical protein